MKKDLNKNMMVVSVLSAAVLLSACSKTDFAPTTSQTSFGVVIPVDQVDEEIPVTPPPVVPPVVAKTFKLSSGTCAQDSSTKILSCLNCDVPQVVQEPQLSAKAQALLDIMVLACQVSNKSDQNNFRPTREMILNKLNQASQKNYPESVRTAQTSLVIEGLTNPHDSSFRQKMFGGLWYKPPYSDSFETYFGLTVREAKSTFCWDGNVQTPSITGVEGVYSKEWLDCTYGDIANNCKESPRYVQAQTYRAQLQKSLSLGISNPYSAPTPDPKKVCKWDKFEGDDIAAAKQQLKKWKSEGRKVKLNIKKSGGAGLCGEAAESLLADGSTIEMATYKCE